MKVIYLGQAGLLFESGGQRVVIDPYFSNSVQEVHSQNFRRKPIDERFLNIKPNVLIFTHSHLDHYDEQTVKHYLNADSNVLVLSPSSVWQEVRKHGGNNNYVLFNRKTVWTAGDFVFRAVKAEHSDRDAVGVVLTHGGKNYYVTGDTLFSEEIFEDLPSEIEAVFLPINGVGNNMNAQDAAVFAKRSGAKKAVPVHFGMFDQMTGEELDVTNRVIPKIYEEIEL